MKIKIKKLSGDAKLPCYAHKGDAGMDLYSNESKTINPAERQIINTGVSIEIPEGYVGLIKDKSGLSANNGLTILAGVIDSSYRGEYSVVVLNTSKEKYEVKQGQKIAQLLILPIMNPEIKEVNELENSSRGEDGFGSTGLD